MKRHGPRRPKQKQLETLPTALGAVIRDARVTCDLTQTEAAERAEIQQSVWSRYENGKKGGTLQTLFDISAALDTPLSKLFAKAEKRLG